MFKYFYKKMYKFNDNHKKESSEYFLNTNTE